MEGIVIYNVLCLLFVNRLNADNVAEYKLKRAKLLETDLQYSLGSKLILTEREIQINEKLMQWKNIDKSFNDPHYVNFSGSYFTYRDAMRRSKVYQMIQRMPKGAALHVHSTLMLDPDDLLKITYDEYFYACLTESYLEFHFSRAVPTLRCPGQWALVKELRKKHSNVTQFDAMLKERLTLGSEDCVTSETEAWKEFKQTMRAIISLEEYRPAREKLLYQSLQNLYNDNVMYAEFRIGLFPLYELNGTVHDRLYMVSLFNQVAKKFMNANPDFAGIKLILSSTRKSLEITRDVLTLARKVKKVMPEVIAGFDLVGHEDLGRPLTDFLPLLLEAQNEIDYYFHAGETNQYGTTVDENLFDAILLGTKRIGHGNALIKHPVLIKAVRDDDIAVEVNVISNSVLSLVQDLRNHPLATYLALGLPVVLSSDDPGVWGAKPLSDDFYVAFVAIASKHADLRMLKQLAINSIRYSALDDKGKTKLFRVFQKRWTEFLQDFTDIENSKYTITIYTLTGRTFGPN